jgi:hypothetical protein
LADKSLRNLLCRRRTHATDGRFRGLNGDDIDFRLLRILCGGVTGASSAFGFSDRIFAGSFLAHPPSISFGNEVAGLLSILSSGFFSSICGVATGLFPVGVLANSTTFADKAANRSSADIALLFNCPAL